MENPTFKNKGLTKKQRLEEPSSTRLNPKSDKKDTRGSVLGLLNGLGHQIQNLQRSENNIERVLQPKNEGILPVLTTNTYFSNFAPASAVPFAKSAIYPGINDNLGLKSVTFDFFQVPEKRTLFLTNLSCRIAPYYDPTTVTTFDRLTQYATDDEFALFGFGFAILANKSNTNNISTNIQLAPSSAGGTPTFPLFPPVLGGAYTSLNNNVLTAAGTPSYLSFLENLSLKTLFQWRQFPQGLGANNNITEYTAVVKASGYLFNTNDYYRFLDSVRAYDVLNVDFAKQR